MSNRYIALSKRMRAVVDMVPPHSSNIADVGCDHAYVSICLKRERNANKVIAMDVRDGPLDIARRNIAEFGLDGEIDVRLSDGLCGLLPGEADTVIIAGMGGLLIRDILKRGRNILTSEEPPVLVLQPQSDIREVRIFLYSVSYHIEQEMMLIEDGKYYTVIRACPGEDKAYEYEEDWAYGRCNIERRDITLMAYLENEEKVLRDIISKLSHKNDDKILRKEDVRNEDNAPEHGNEQKSSRVILTPAAETDSKVRRIYEIEERLRINKAAYTRCINDEM